MLDKIRRIVTGHNSRGKSIVQSDEPIEAVLEMHGHGLGDVWHLDKVPANLNAEDVTKDLNGIQLEPKPNGVIFRYFLVPPDPKDVSEAAKAEMTALMDAAFDIVGAKHARIDTTRHPAMHKTGTIDLIVVIKGYVTLILDEDERDLVPGDTVVQCGTNHAWSNKSEEAALLLAVLVDAESE